MDCFLRAFHRGPASSGDQLVFIPPSFTVRKWCGRCKHRKTLLCRLYLSLSLSLSLLTLPSLRPSSGKPTDQQVQHNNNTRHSGHGWTRSWSRAYREFSFYQLTSDLPCRRGRGDRTGDQVACSFTLVLLNKSDNSLIMLRPFIIAANWNWNQRNP